MSQTDRRTDSRPERAGRWVLVATILASSMAFINESALTVSLPAIQRDLGAGGAQLLWILNAYTLMLASFILVGGSLGDQLGRRRVFMAGILLFCAGSLACGLAPSAALLIGSRALQGLGGAFMIPGSLALITASFAPDRRGRAIGTWAAVTTLALIAGPLIGGLLAEAGLWRGLFLLGLPLAAVSLAILRARVPESRGGGKTARIDLAGTALVSAGLGALTYGFTTAPRLGFGHPLILGPLLAGTAALAAFTVVERRGRTPMVPLQLFSSRTFTGVNLLTLFLYAGLYGYFPFLTLNLVQAQGYRESQAGLAFLPFMLLLALISRWSGKLMDRTGPRLPLIVGPAVTAVGFLFHALIGSTAGPRDYWVTFFPAVFVVGVGMGITVAPLTTTVMSAVDERFAGTASGVNNSLSRVAEVLAVAVLGSMALFVFSGEVERRATVIGLPAAARAELRAETARLGEAAVPPGVPPERAGEVRRLLHGSLVDTFRRMMALCAALAAVSVVMTVLFVREDRVPR